MPTVGSEPFAPATEGITIPPRPSAPVSPPERPIYYTPDTLQAMIKQSQKYAGQIPRRPAGRWTKPEATANEPAATAGRTWWGDFSMWYRMIDSLVESLSGSHTDLEPGAGARLP